MHPPLCVDVAIIGGGPAGASAALAICRGGDLSIAILEAGTRPERKIGETLPPEARYDLERLGVWQSVCAAGHQPSQGTCSAWGGAELAFDDVLFKPHGVGWHLDRRRFDEMLLQEARARGAVILRPATVGRALPMPEEWQLELKQPGEPGRELCAKFVIDASGRGQSLHVTKERWKVFFDHLVGLYAFFVLDELASRCDNFTMVETTEGGWWYSALLPGQQLVVVHMTDADQALTSRLQHPQRWLERAQLTSHTNRRLRGARMIARPRVALARSQLLHPVAGARWLAIGDAASSFDPLSSQGIAKALRTGLRAADVIRTGQVEAYAQQIAAEFEHYLETREHYYRMEARWPRSPFWNSRHGKITLHPTQTLQCIRLEQVSQLRMHMPVGDLERLALLCPQPRPAHELVTEFRSLVATTYSDSRIIRTLQYLVESGVLEHSRSNRIQSTYADTDL